jgi:hypothetical protein
VITINYYSIKYIAITENMYRVWRAAWQAWGKHDGVPAVGTLLTQIGLVQSKEF